MNKRERKKYLKKKHEYFDPKECWDLDCNITKYVLPRLKYFRKHTSSYPGTLNNENEWNEILDKMIMAFEYRNQGDDWWFKNPRWNYIDYPELCTFKEHIEEDRRRNLAMQEGFELFGKWFLNLWD